MPPQIFGNAISWGSDTEPATIAQAQMTAGLPIIHKHLALMSDAHVGKGSTIGSVIATINAVIPAAVGTDLGCGVAALPLSLRAENLPADLSSIHAAISAAVPAGVGQGHAESQEDAMLNLGLDIPSHFTQKQRATALNQFGSLGAGNHFVELCLDKDDRVWILLHSGSRGIGNQLATYHVNVAKERSREHDLPDPDLAWLTERSPTFDAYITDMKWAQQYALCNRAQMATAIVQALTPILSPFTTGKLVNNNHNFTRKEIHNGKEVWLTRKGAIPAPLGKLGIIPGSMGTKSYIVRGLGNKLSYCSCSHGAGRRMSRGQARRELTAESLTEAMVGKTWNAKDAGALVDEHPRAYKDIDSVMEDQRDLVRAVHVLCQVINYKGVR